MLRLWLWNRLRREDGQAMVEYGIIIGLVSVVAIGLLATIGLDVKGYFQAIIDTLTAPAA